MGQRAAVYAVGIVLFAALVLTAQASAQLRATSDTLPGSSFQGADGNQDDEAPDVDWQRFVEPTVRVEHNDDPNDEDSIFAGGNAGQETEPGLWDLTTQAGGANPSSSNVHDAWSAVDQPNANTFVYLGFTRETADGTIFLTFELNHDGRLWNNGRASIPCRRTGDVQVSFEQRGSSIAEVFVVVRRWRTTATDPDTGCARSGELITALAQPSDAIQGAFNAGPIDSRLPGALTGMLGAGLFGEAALNLSALLERAFDEECMAFNSIWMHSRSSQQITANMEDYVAPRSISVWTCTASGTKFFDSNANGQRDSGEPGIPRFMIWADYDNDGLRDRNEPFSVSDGSGRYVIHDIRPPTGIYWLRERLLRRALPVASDWTCSYPNNSTAGGTGSANGGRFPCAWGPINVNDNPNVRGGRDFGNWFAVPPIPPTPLPEPAPVVPPGPTPPDADDAGTAGLILERTIQGCIGRRVPRVNLRGTRIASVRIYVNGRFIRGLTLDVLQRRVRPRVTLAPGQRYRIRVRVTFQRGTGSPPVTLIGTIRTCARPPVACPSKQSEPGARIACASSAIVRRRRRPT